MMMMMMMMTKSLETSSITVPFTDGKPRKLQHYMDCGESLKSHLTSTKVKERVELYFYSPCVFMACSRANITFYLYLYNKIIAVLTKLFTTGCLLKNHNEWHP
jgi:hypothetical protein